MVLSVCTHSHTLLAEQNVIYSTHVCTAMHVRPQVGNSGGYENPCGLRVRVATGWVRVQIAIPVSFKTTPRTPKTVNF